MIISFWELQKIKITYDTSTINSSVYFKPSAPTMLELSPWIISSSVLSKNSYSESQRQSLNM